MQGMVQKNSDCEIVRSDFSDFLLDAKKQGCADLILTDPPYTISKKTGFASVGKKSVKRFAVSMDFGKWDAQQIDLCKMAQGFYRVLRTGGTAIVWYDLWKLSHLSAAMSDAGFRMLRIIIWEKTNPVPLNMKATYLSNSREIAVVGVKGGKPTFHSQYDNGNYRQPIPRQRGGRAHPTQKPLDLFCALIQKHSNKGDLVIDPFLGAGTTALAAKMTDRKFMGCDISAEYTRRAKKRLREYTES